MTSLCLDRRFAHRIQHLLHTGHREFGLLRLFCCSALLYDDLRYFVATHDRMIVSSSSAIDDDKY